jgi:type III secretory pathway component EscU
LISSTHKYIKRGKTDIVSTHIHRKSICVLRISILPLSMYLCVEDIGCTSFYVFVGLGYRLDLFLCICVLMISVLPFSICLCVEDISFTCQHTNTYKEVKPISSTHTNIERGKTDILNTQIHRKW